VRQLVLVHGRDQQRRDPAAMKAEWLAALAEGLRKSGLALPGSDSDIRLAYYGDTLDQMSRGMSADAAARVILQGDGDPAWQEFCGAVAREAQERFRLTDAEVAAAADLPVIEQDAWNWRSTQAILRALDRCVPGASATAIARKFHDVWQYLTNSPIREEINEGASLALARDAETVVVGHSLGTVVAYNLLLQKGEERNWRVPLFLTAGSPLGITAVRQAVRNLAQPQCPPCTARWLNARDTRDPVALYPLTPEHFPLRPPQPAIANYTGVTNPPADPHGICGYLADARVAREIYQALCG
jgi:hypothetical protein